MTDLAPERVTASFGCVAGDWDELRLAYYDEAVIERLPSPTSVPALGSSPP